MKDILHRYVRERAGGNLEGALRGLTTEYLRYRGKYDAVAAEKAYMILIYSLLDAYKNAGYNFTREEEIAIGATLATLTEQFPTLDFNTMRIRIDKKGKNHLTMDYRDGKIVDRELGDTSGDIKALTKQEEKDRFNN